VLSSAGGGRIVVFFAGTVAAALAEVDAGEEGFAEVAVVCEEEAGAGGSGRGKCLTGRRRRNLLLADDDLILGRGVLALGKEGAEGVDDGGGACFRQVTATTRR